MATVISLADVMLKKKRKEVQRIELRAQALKSEGALHEVLNANIKLDPVIFAAQRRYQTQCLPLVNFVPDPTAPCFLDAPELSVLLDKRRKRSTLRVELARYAETADPAVLYAYLSGTQMWVAHGGVPAERALTINVEDKYIVSLFDKAGIEGYVTMLAKYANRINVCRREPYGPGPATDTTVYLPLGQVALNI